MLKAYFNGTRKKFVATTLALTLTFSAVVIPPLYHSYDSALLQTNAIGTEDELQNLRDAQATLMNELQEIKQKETSVSENVEQRLNDAIIELRSEINDAYHNRYYDDIERINKINSAITNLEYAASIQGNSVFRTLIDTFTDNTKDLLDEIFDNLKSFNSKEGLKKSKKLIDVLINNLCKSVERIADLTAKEVDPQNRKSEIKNRLVEIELQILNKIGSQTKDDDTSKSLVEVLANKFYEADNKRNAVEDEYNAAQDKWYKLTSEHEEAIKPAKAKWETALKNYETAAKKYQTITLNLSDDEYKTIFDTIIDATNKVDEARKEYFDVKTEADNKYSADIAAAKSEYMKLKKEYSELDDVIYEVEYCLDIGIITSKDLARAFFALGYSEEQLDEFGFIDIEEELDDVDWLEN